MNAREVLKRKMQILLNKQCESCYISLDAYLTIPHCADKEDKKIETMKRIQQLQEQKERETEMRELALKLRKRYAYLKLTNATS